MIDSRTAPYAALLLRVSLGVLFLAHAGLKFFVFTPAGTAKFFGSVGLPPELAYLVMAAEILAAVASEGLSTRVVLFNTSTKDPELIVGIARGAYGLILRDTTPAVLVQCLRQVAAGRVENVEHVRRAGDPERVCTHEGLGLRLGDRDDDAIAHGVFP